MSEFIALFMFLGCLGVVYYYLERDTFEKSKLEQLRQKLIENNRK